MLMFWIFTDYYNIFRGFIYSLFDLYWSKSNLTNSLKAFSDPCCDDFEICFKILLLSLIFLINYLTGWFELVFLFTFLKRIGASRWKYSCLYICALVPFFFIFWKSYMFSCLMKEANLLCLKYWGNMHSSNSVWFVIWKPYPSNVQHIIYEYYSLFYNISYNLQINCGTQWCI